MPKFHQLLLALAFNVILAEQVDVVVIETGVGGECDFTNVIR